MLIGHYAPALILQRARRTVPLWALFFAVQLVDFVWALAVFGGLEHVRIVRGFTASNDLDLWDMPYSHGLLATAVWAGGAFVLWIALWRKQTRVGDAALVALAVASHFLLDWVVHVHDLPLYTSNGTKLGLGLWEQRWLALAVECGLFAVASLLWWRGSERGRVAGVLLGGMMIFAVASYFIPTPPNAMWMAAIGLFTWILIPLLALRVR